MKYIKTEEKDGWYCRFSINKTQPNLLIIERKTILSDSKPYEKKLWLNKDEVLSLLEFLQDDKIICNEVAIVLK